MNQNIQKLPSAKPAQTERLVHIKDRVHTLLEGTQGFEELLNHKPYEILRSLIQDALQNSTMSGDDYKMRILYLDEQRDTLMATLTRENPVFAKAYQDLLDLHLSDTVMNRLPEELEPLLLEQIPTPNSSMQIIYTDTQLKELLQLGKDVRHGSLPDGAPLLPREINLERVRLDQIDLEELKDLFAGLREVRKLYFTNTRISELPSEVLSMFNSLLHIKEVRFSTYDFCNADIKDKYPVITPFLERLTRVIMCEDLEDLGSEEELRAFIKPFRKLKSMYFSPDNIDRLTPSQMNIIFEGLPLVEHIGMIQAHIEHLDEAQVEVVHRFFTQARFLCLNYNHFDNMPTHLLEQIFFDLPNIQEISILGDNISEEVKTRIWNLAKGKNKDT